MVHISASLLNNVEETRIKLYLKRNSCSKKNDGELLNEWISRLIESKEISIDSLNEFLFNELMYGKRKYIQIYNINSVKDIKSKEIWINKYLSRHNINSLNYNKIIETNPTDSNLKISAIDYEENINGSLSKLYIIYVKRIYVRNESSTSEVLTYLPVEIDFSKKIISVKVYNRQGVADENNLPKNMIESLIEHLVAVMGISIGTFEHNPSQVLYRMSKGLMNDFFNNIPNMDKLIELDEKINDFISEVTSLGNFANKEVVNYNGKNYNSLNKDVIDLKTEVGFLLQQATVFDYFFDRDINEILDKLDIILVCLRFNDKDNVTTSLSGENRRKALFDSKTLMSLRKSMDLVKSLSYITICYQKEKGFMKVKYDASEPSYLCIHVLSQRYFTEEDYDRIWEIYRSYESENVTDVRKLCS